MPGGGVLHITDYCNNFEVMNEKRKFIANNDRIKSWFSFWSSTQEYLMGIAVGSCWLFISTDVLKIFVSFWSKMVLKKLQELTANELRIELRRAGIKGKYVKAEAIMRLTTFLIDVSEDPLSFEFDPDVPVEADTDKADGDEYEVVTDTPDTMTAVTSSAGVGAIS